MSWTWKTSGPGLVWNATQGYRFINWETATWNDNGGGWQFLSDVANGSQHGGYAYTGTNHLTQWADWVTSQKSQVLSPEAIVAEDVGRSDVSGVTTPPGNSSRYVVDPVTGSTADPEWLVALAHATGNDELKTMSDSVSEKHLWWSQGWTDVAETLTPMHRDEDGSAATKRRLTTTQALSDALQTLSLGQTSAVAMDPTVPEGSVEPKAKLPRCSPSN